jgi:uncharacterized protein YlxW (UPF0749 family)
MAADTQPTVGDSIAPIIQATSQAPASRVATLHPRARGVMGIALLSAMLLLAGGALGAVISAEWQAQPASDLQATAPLTRQSGREMVAGTIRRLEDEQAGLKAQITDLRAEINTLRQDGAASRVPLLDLHKELERQRLASGLVPVRGSGIIATLSDSDVRAVPPGDDPANYIIHEYDLRDVLNALWAAGAEAIALNGERIVGNSSVYCVGTTIICNATRLSPPYTLQAIGDPAALAAALRESRQMAKFNARARQFDLPFTIEERSDLQLPAYNGSVTFKHATVEK